MPESPLNITTEVERDYPGRFVVEVIELNRLLADITRQLKPENDKQALKISFWVRLENGVVYETDKLEDVFKEENSRRKTIRLLVIYAELVDTEDKVLRRIVIQFSRGDRKDKPDMLEHIKGEAFNLSYHGLNYRVRDKDRASALEVISIIEERLVKFRGRSSEIPLIRVTPHTLAITLAISVTITLLIYAISGLASSFSTFLYYPRFTTDFLQAVGFSVVGLALAAILAQIIIGGFYWLIPETYFEIGDEINEHKRRQKLRKFVVIGILFAIIVDIAANLLTPTVSSWLGGGR